MADLSGHAYLTAYRMQGTDQTTSADELAMMGQ